MKLSGLGTTISFGTITFAPELYAIQLPDAEEISRLGASSYDQAPGDYARMEPGQLHRIPEAVFSYYFDPDDLPPLRVKDDITITLPTPPAGLTGATLSGSGFIYAVAYPNLEDIREGEDDLLLGSFSWQFDGYTGPTWTAST